MLNKLKKKLLLCLTVMFMFSSAQVYASGLENSTVKVENALGTGDIRIHIEEYMKDGSTRYDNSEPRQVLPGQDVDKIVKVCNDAEDAWIRVKAEFTTSDKSVAMDESMLKTNKEWTFINGYWYKKEIVSKNEKVEFMTGFSIPPEFGNEVSNGEFGLNIQAEAVQAKHFTPNFDAEYDPWNGTVIEYCLHEDEYEMGEEDDATFIIDYRGGSEGLIKMVDGVDGEDNFFRNWTRFMPGDTFEGHFVVQNQFYNPVTIYFHTESSEKTAINEDPLLPACNLKITGDDGTVLFDGPMSTVIDHPIAIGKFVTGTEKDFTFKVSVPDWIQNAYSLLGTQTVWVFETAYGDKFELPETGVMNNNNWWLLSIIPLFIMFIFIGKGAYKNET